MVQMSTQTGNYNYMETIRIARRSWSFTRSREAYGIPYYDTLSYESLVISRLHICSKKHEVIFYFPYANAILILTYRGILVFPPVRYPSRIVASHMNTRDTLPRTAQVMNLHCE